MLKPNHHIIQSQHNGHGSKNITLFMSFFQNKGTKVDEQHKQISQHSQNQAFLTVAMVPGNTNKRTASDTLP
jgi:hypothetical protein